MKEAVLKIIRERIAGLVDKENPAQIDVQKYPAYVELRVLEKAVSALPEQGVVHLETLMKDSEGVRYTREQVVDAYKAGITKTVAAVIQQKRVLTSEEYVSSLTPVAVEVEQTQGKTKEELAREYLQPQIGLLRFITLTSDYEAFEQCFIAGYDCHDAEVSDLINGNKTDIQ